MIFTTEYEKDYLQKRLSTTPYKCALKEVKSYLYISNRSNGELNSNKSKWRDHRWVKLINTMWAGLIWIHFTTPHPHGLPTGHPVGGPLIRICLLYFSLWSFQCIAMFVVICLCMFISIELENFV